MKLKLIVASLVIAAAPASALAQSAITNEDAQQLVETIRSDPDKIQTYCNLLELGHQTTQADQRDDLHQQMHKLDEKLGPEWSALITAYRDVDLNTKAGLETAATMQTTIDALNKLCGPAAQTTGRE